MTVTPRVKALLVMPSFFGYERDIAAEFERQGIDVTLLDERPSNRSMDRAVLRVKPNLMRQRIAAHYERALAQDDCSGLDLVVVVKAEVVPRWFLEDLRAKNPTARFVFYTFDALDNAGNCRELLDCFDERLTFDTADVKASDGAFGYLPLFYTPDFAAAPGVGQRRWLLSFTGTLHSDRYTLAKALFGTRADVHGFFYVQARWYFALVKYVTGEHRNVPWADVSFTSVSRREIAKVFRESKAVLDVQRPGQTGLTMRTFEVLASGAILVTTNPAIMGEPFYDPQRVVVLPSATTGDAEQLHRMLDDLPVPDGPPAGFESNSLASWVERLVGAGRRSDARRS